VTPPFLVLLAALGAGTPAPGPAASPQVVLETTKGEIVLELDRAKAPLSVDNFLAYVKSGHYDGTLFHRVIPGFMIQGGGMDKSMRPKEGAGREPVRNEAANGLKNTRGTVAMARTSDPHSARAQFFINLADNRALDHRDSSVQGFGYAVFGRVVSGMEVVDAIAKVRTTSHGPHDDVPVEAVVITRARPK
jgi:peptidyl-prolyl cis-trans isomerase B (cyclophilin B)